MNMNLTSYPKFAEYQARMDEQTRRLHTQLGEVEEDIQGLMREYSSLFQEGKNTNAVMSDIQALKEKAKTIKGEIEIIEESDFREKELAQEIYNQFTELKREVNEESFKLYEESEKLKDDCIAAIEKINERLLVLQQGINQVAKDQLAPVVGHLDVHESLKWNLNHEANSGVTLGYSSVSNLTRN
jgi:chromosome segregation ATPase